MDKLLKQQFLILLQSGLWSDVNLPVELFKGKVLWNDLFTIAKQQTVTAIVWDGIEKLPLELQPNRSIRMAWYSYVIQIENTNQLLNQKVVEVFDLYQKVGLKPILLKGAGIATLYSNPLHRGCGDIDVYVGIDGCKIANQAIITAGATNLKDDGGHHSNLTYGSITIENHRIMAVLFTKSANDEFEKEIINSRCLSYPNYVTIQGKQIAVLPHPFNVTFLFAHFYKHFINLGVGLRQVCDIMMALDKNPIKDIVPLLTYRKSWTIFVTMCVDYLGLPKEKAPCYNVSYHKKAEKMLEIILDDGNFGFNDALFSCRPKGYIAGKLYSFYRQLLRWLKLFKLLPIDTLQYIFYYKIKNSINAIKQDKF